MPTVSMLALTREIYVQPSCAQSVEDTVKMSRGLMRPRQSGGSLPTCGQPRARTPIVEENRKPSAVMGEREKNR